MGIVKDIPILLDTGKTRIVHPPGSRCGRNHPLRVGGAAGAVESGENLAHPERHPVVFEALEVDLPAGRAHSEAWHRYPPVKAVEVAPNHWRWEIRDMQRLDLRDVKASLEWEALAARMSVTWGEAAVAGKDNQWRAFGQLDDQY